MGAVRNSGGFWVAVLKRDPHGQNITKNHMPTLINVTKQLGFEHWGGHKRRRTHENGVGVGNRVENRFIENKKGLDLP